MLTLRLSEDIEKRLNALSEKTGRTKSYYCKKAIEEFLEDREDYLIALAALERNESTITLDELVSKIELGNNNYQNR